MSKKYFIMLIYFYPIFIFSSIWSVGAGFDFETIQDAIDDIYDVVESGDTLSVRSGVYDHIVIEDEGYVIEAYESDVVIIDGFNTACCIAMTLNSNTATTLRNLTIQNGNSRYKGGGIYSPRDREIVIEDCIIQNCRTYFNNVHPDGGGGIYSRGILEIYRSTIANCESDNGCGGGIFINDGSLLIKSSNITNSCSQTYGGGIYIYGTSEINIENCIIDNCDSETGGGICIDTASNDINDCNIVSSIFRNCISDYGGGIATLSCSVNLSKSIFYNNISTNTGSAMLILNQNMITELNINVTECVFYTNTCSHSTLKIELGSLNEPNTFLMSNSTICNNIGGMYPGVSFYNEDCNDIILKNSIILDVSEITEVEYNYCCLWEGASGYDATCYVDDPQFVDGANDDYHLEWDSPCIDSGNPDNDGDFENWVFDDDDQDADGSRLSIGCFPYEDQDRWEFGDGDIVWMSIPKIPCVDGENNGDLVLGSTVFERFQELETHLPDSIFIWQERDLGYSPNFSGIYDNNEEEYDWYSSNFSLNSTDGLKIKINDINQNDNPINPLITGGLLCESSTPITVTTGVNDLNWAGYFIPYKMNVMNAIDTSTLDKLTAIKTHDWSLYKKNGSWYGSSPPGGTTLCYGDMVELFTDETEDFTFCWQTFGSSGEEYERQETQYFTYKEELDYQSIFIELGETLPDEIAVFVDGECKGAEVVDVDSLLEIRAYIFEEPQGQVIEIVTSSDRENTNLVKYRVMNDKDEFVNRSLFTDSSKMYQRVSLKINEDIPEKKDFISCYPNPFNPQLTISYALTESVENSEIDIYNAKGQCIRKLEINCGRRETGNGRQSVVWDGKDDSGKQVSSGVYFIRMKVDDKTHTKKAVLMK